MKVEVNVKTPLYRETGVGTAPCLKFHAEGGTLKFGFGHEKVRTGKEADFCIIL